MIFTSLVFFIFFLIVWSGYWLLSGKQVRQDFALAASLFFYGWWDWRFLGLIGFVIVTAHMAAVRIDRTPRRRGWVLAGAVGIMLGVLSIFKYFNFFVDSAAAVLNALGFSAAPSALSIVLPVGISFYTFQAISYVVDVYRGELPAERRLRTVAFYIAYFPQLVAGPIVRAVEFLPQTRRDVHATPDDLSAGLADFIVGFTYKAALADNLAAFVDPIYAAVPAYDNRSLIWATIGFHAQIYFDFAGYSLMAIGIARMMGYKLSTNFDFPYRALNITDFWRRWHISLSQWLRNYLYIPLGGNRRGKFRRYLNLMVTMLLGGLWHGASWNFVLWGGLHGAGLVVHKGAQWATARMDRWGVGAIVQMAEFRIPTLVAAWCVTQGFVLLTWVPFRAQTFADTGQVVLAFAGLRPESGLQAATVPYFLLTVPFLVDTCLGRAVYQGLQRRTVPPFAYAVAMGALFALILTVIRIDSQPFIYFQF